MIDPRIVLFAAGSLLFGALIVVQLSAGAADGVAVVPAAAGRNGDGAKPPRIAPPADSLVTTILARPLFTPDRRPPASPQSPGADLKDKRFAGIVIEPDRRLAIFAVTGGKPLAVTEGDSVDGWQIESITVEEITLASTQGSRTLRLTPAPASGESRTQPRKIAARSSAASKQGARAEMPQSDPKTPSAAEARPPVRTFTQPSANAQTSRTTQAPPSAPLPTRASQPPRFMQLPSESERNTQSLPAAAGTVGQRP